MGEAPEIKSGTEGLRETPPRIPDGPGRFACTEGTQERPVRPSAPTRICRSRAGDLGQLTRGPELVPPPLLSETRGISGRGVLGAGRLSSSLPAVLGVVVVVLLRQGGAWARVTQNGVVVPALSLPICVNLDGLRSIAVSYSILGKVW